MTKKIVTIRLRHEDEQRLLVNRSFKPIDVVYDAEYCSGEEVNVEVLLLGECAESSKFDDQAFFNVLTVKDGDRAPGPGYAYVGRYHTKRGGHAMVYVASEGVAVLPSAQEEIGPGPLLPNPLQKELAGLGATHGMIPGHRPWEAMVVATREGRQLTDDEVDRLSEDEVCVAARNGLVTVERGRKRIQQCRDEERERQMRIESWRSSPDPYG